MSKRETLEEMEARERRINERELADAEERMNTGVPRRELLDVIEVVRLRYALKMLVELLT